MTEHATSRAVGASGYAGGCRCDGCRDGKRRDKTRYAKQKYLAQGRLTIPADRSRARLQWLRANGVSMRRVAELIGCGAPWVRRIASGHSKSVSRGTEQAIFAITLADADSDALVDADLTWRRLHGLMALGWPAQQLADDLGYKRDERRRTIPMSHTRVTVRHARAVVALCVQYGDTLGPSELTMHRAKREGWAPYGTWEDDLTLIAYTTTE